jgi:hypothetical protein
MTAAEEPHHTQEVDIKTQAAEIKKNMSWLQYFRGFFNSLYWLTLGRYDTPTKHKEYLDIYNKL